MKKILAIGEVLFDVIKGQEYMGGAPFNYVFHLNAFNQLYNLGFQVEFATKICNDDRGKRVLDFFNKHRISTRLLQANDVYETGVVYASVDSHHNVHYHIEEHCAYDYIDYSRELGDYIHSGIDFLYYGTLFLRSGHNRSTLAKCLPDDAIFNQKIMIDFNFRQNYYNWEIIDDCLLNACYIKLNHEELNLLNKKYLSDYGLTSERDVIDFLLDEYVLDGIILTKGAKGAGIYVTETDYWECQVQKAKSITDTVGAGDAFSSVFTMGTLLNWPMPLILERATEFATHICQIQGAIPHHEQWYDTYKNWFK